MNENEEQDIQTSNKKNDYSGLITFIIIVALAIFIWNVIGANSSGERKHTNGKPDDVELLSYAQTVLEDNLHNPKYSSYSGDYNFIETGLRYKIEGKVNGENFWMIIKFTDNTYKEYDLVSLQVGDKKIY